MRGRMRAAFGNSARPVTTPRSGAARGAGRVIPAREWFDRLDAPSKQWVEFDHSSHRASFEEPAAYSALMARVLADTDLAAE